MSIKDDMKKFLADEIVRWVRNEGVTQAVAAKAMGITQPRMSNLMKGRLEMFSVDSLMECLHSSGYVIRMTSTEDVLTIKMVNL